ncbi:hypothetical protein H100_00230, partial [Trichophyton rubrum MR850]
ISFAAFLRSSKNCQSSLLSIRLWVRGGETNGRDFDLHPDLDHPQPWMSFVLRTIKLQNIDRSKDLPCFWLNLQAKTFFARISEELLSTISMAIPFLSNSQCSMSTPYAC